MQRLYRPLFNTIYIATKHLNDTIRYMAIFLCCFALMWTYFFGSMRDFEGDAQKYGTYLVLTIIILSIDRKMQPINWNKWTYYSLIFFGIGILIIEQIHPLDDGYRVYALDLLLVFPALHYVWANRGDYEKIYRLMSLAIFVLCIASFFYCIHLSLHGELGYMRNRVSGLRFNPNSFSRLGAISLLAGIYLTYENYNNRFLAVLFSIASGIGISYIMLSSSKTGLLSALVCFISLLVFIFKGRKKKNAGIKTATFTLLLVIVTIVASLVIGMQLDNLNSKVLLKQHEEDLAQMSEEEREEEKAVERKTPDAYTVTERIKSAQDANSLSSGRIRLWKEYMKRVSVSGTQYEELEEVYGTRKVYYAHNNIVEYLFRCGIIVGLLYAVFFVSQGLFGLKVLFSREYTKAKHFFLVSVIGYYSLIAMVDIAMFSFAGCYACLYFVSMTPVMVKGVK